MTIASVVCPYCSLHCDDVSPVALRSGQTGCSLADSRASLVRVASASRSVNSDLETCRRWVEEASRLVISGYVIDLETARAISEFASRNGADVDVLGTNPIAAQVFAREGGFLTTLGELTGRDISVLVIGDPMAFWPRIGERLQHAKGIVRLADSPDLPHHLATLRTQVATKSLDEMSDDHELDAAIRLINDATYLVVLIAPLQESASRSPVVWSSILGLVRDRNKVSRAAVLSFDPSITVRSVIASRNDPRLFTFPSDETSLSIAFSPFGEAPTQRKGRTIIIGLSKQSLDSNQRLLPAGLPGMHHDGIVIRGDGSVTLPLQSWHAGSVSDFPLSTPSHQLRSLMA